MHTDCLLSLIAPFQKAMGAMGHIFVFLVGDFRRRPVRREAYSKDLNKGRKKGLIRWEVRYLLAILIWSVNSPGNRRNREIKAQSKRKGFWFS